MPRLGAQRVTLPSSEQLEVSRRPRELSRINHQWTPDGREGESPRGRKDLSKNLRSDARARLGIPESSGWWGLLTSPELGFVPPMVIVYSPTGQEAYQLWYLLLRLQHRSRWNPSARHPRVPSHC